MKSRRVQHHVISVHYIMLVFSSNKEKNWTLYSVNIEDRTQYYAKLVEMAKEELKNDKIIETDKQKLRKTESITLCRVIKRELLVRK